MRNRIKGYWDWNEAGIQPAELAPTAALVPTRRPAATRPRAAVAPTKTAHLALTTLVVAGSFVAGIAIAWGLGAVVRRI